MKHRRQHKTQNNTNTASHKGQKIRKIGNQKRHQAYDQDHHPPQPQAVPGPEEPSLHHLIHRVHHNRKSEKQINTKPQLNQHTNHPRPQISGNNILSFFPKSQVP
ncbi:hypothetical protein JHK82_030447 [Glycine max]|nr:hypothetical protein JHK87_030349 [Glycine soja]KAG4993715.1 hypothetical protein JHK86_030542 [Glycine max]KAG5123710.1 hypothetical protein JHK82_030447 [Glycine max]KAG5145126.1 hypothetical protein JHK84_030669 [Glycine max]